jgi:molecular chaperone DnaK
MPERETILGIDFGTAYTSAAALLGGKASFVLDDGDPLIPSVVHIPRQGPPVVGVRAVQLGIAQPAATVTSVKRLLGRGMSDPEVRLIDAGVGYRIKAGPQQMAVLEIRDQTFAPTQIAGYVLERVRDLAARRFGGRVERAVMTVPVAATPAYRDALRQAARIAGLEVLQFIAEPIAGGIALGMNMQACDRRLAVCDFGGGTFDATLLEQRGHGFKPVAVAGDAFLGGDDFDDALANAVADDVFRSTRKDMHQDIVRWRELVWHCESIKRQLSGAARANLRMKEAVTHGGQRRDLNVAIDRSWAEPRWQPLVARAVEALQRLLESSTWEARSVDEVLLIGGTTMIPLVRRAFAEFFGRAVTAPPHADVAVTMGAAIQTAAHAPT